jgi:3-phenylpropionate/trans-cinnamate dioxygenase ferredoxin subunit
MTDTSASADQSLVGFLSNDDWDALLIDLDQRIARMEALPDGDTKRELFELLNAIDAMHREALHRLTRLFKDGVLEKVVSDPAIHTLMELYDLLPESAATEAGKPPKPAFPTIPIRPVRAAPPPAPPRYPHWVPVLASADELASGALRDDVAVDGIALLLARRDQRWFALESRCPVDGAPLAGARLDGYTLSCPQHAGCHYDVRTGARVGGGPALACFPVKTDDGDRVLVGLDMDFSPSLPSF